MKLMELLVIAYAPLVARFHLIDGSAALRNPMQRPRQPRAKRVARIADFRAAIARRGFRLTAPSHEAPA